MGNDSGNKNDDFNIFGQKLSYPNNVYAVISVVAVCIAVSVILCFGIAKGGIAAKNDSTVVAIGGIVSTSFDVKAKKIHALTDEYKMSFWTPSLDTVARLGKVELDNHNYDWIRGVNESDIQGFIDAINKSKCVHGFRYYPVSGRGPHVGGAILPGVWWNASVSNDCNPSKILDIYVEKFKTPNRIYVEYTNFDITHD